MNTITNKEREKIQERADYLAKLTIKRDDIVEDLMQRLEISKERAIRHAAKAIRKQNKPK